MNAILDFEFVIYHLVIYVIFELAICFAQASGTKYEVRFLTLERILLVIEGLLCNFKLSQIKQDVL